MAEGRFTVARDAFVEVLAIVSPAAARRSKIPILSNVLLQAEGGTLVVAATDIDLKIEARCPLIGADHGAITVAAAPLTALTRRLPDGGEMVLSWADAKAGLAVKCGRSTYRLDTLPAEDFPDIAAPQDAVVLEVPAAELRWLLSTAASAMSKEETRYYLNGIYLAVAGDRLVAVATDGIRLIEAQAPAPQGAAPPGVILPRPAIADLLRPLGSKPEGTARLTVSERRAVLDYAGIKVNTTLVGGTFPDYGRIVPFGNPLTVSVDTEDLKIALGRHLTIAGVGRTKFAFSAGELVISGHQDGVGSGSETLVIEGPETPLEIGFSGRLLLELLDQVEGETVELKLADPGSPMLLRGKGDDRMFAVLMPLRV